MFVFIDQLKKEVHKSSPLNDAVINEASQADRLRELLANRLSAYLIPMLIL